MQKADPVSVVNKLPKFWPTDIILVGPVKETKKEKEISRRKPKEEAQKEDQKRKKKRM